MRAYEPVIGLEVHAQLKTRTKIFCGCSTRFGSRPNSQTCPVCLGHPGALPVLNRRAVELAVTGALALDCEIPSESIFARKNYFYPDLPKGYQISQYDRPLAVGGEVDIEVEGRERTIGLIRLHLEEDAGKSVHEGDEPFSRIDLNRSGVPLVEIVSRPEIRSPDEAYLFLQRLRSILRYTDVCDGNMEQGSLRCDANISIRPEGQTELGTRTELKNINSFRNVRRALEYEIRRQTGLVQSGQEVVQETVLWDAAADVTRPMRGKEEADDYRYFPEPDLPPVHVERVRVEALKRALPELPSARKRRIKQSYGLSEYEAQLLTLESSLADYFERVAENSGDPKAAANFILNDLAREHRDADAAIPVSAEHLVELIGLVGDGTISISVARQEIFERMISSGEAPGAIVAELGLQQVSDADSLRAMVLEVLEAHPGQLEQYRRGKHGLLGFFVGQVMQRSGGKANPRMVRELLEKEIG